MERVLIALDCIPGGRKIVDYLARVLEGTRGCEFVLFHILPTASPGKLRMGEVERIERIHSERPDLAGYFWREEDEKCMRDAFALARETLTGSGFGEELISSHFSVESGDLADIILQKADEFGCSTIIMGRRRIGRVKGFLLGSVSGAVLKMARGKSVWVIDN
ncbi:MAG: universal stress protein [Syntrophobacteraceae bacterium]